MLLMVVAFLASCSPDQDLISPSNKEGQAQLIFNFADDGGLSRSGSVATTEERKLSSIGMMFYDEKTGDYVDNTVANIANSGGQTGSATFELPSKVASTAGRYKILLFTNGSTDLPSGGSDLKSYMSQNTTQSYDNMRSLLQLKYTERIRPNLPYYGESTYINSGVESSMPTLSASFKRTVAKFELQHKAVDKLYIEWAKVSNYSSMGFLASDNVPQMSEIMRGEIGGDLAEAPVNHSDFEGNFIQQSITSGLYAFPNIVAYTSQGDNITTCLLVKGKYKKEGWTEGTVPTQAQLDAVPSSYYRVNIHTAMGEPQVLRRNKLYRVTIGNVTGEGEPDEEGALNSSDAKLELETDDWEDPEGGDILTDPDGTFMKINPSTMIFEAYSDIVQLGSVQMSNGGTWTASITKGAEFFEIISDPNAPSSELRVRTKMSNTGYFSQNGEILIQGHRQDGSVSGSLVHKVMLVQLTSDKKIDLLTVDGKTGTIEVTAPGNGAILTFPVLTGSQLNQWNAVPDPSIASWCTFTPSGGNGTIFRLNVSPNVSGNRSGVVTIHFGLTPDIPGAPAPVKILVTQDRSTSDISVFPTFSAENPLRIDAFSPEIGNPNGCSVGVDISAYTVNETLYPKYVVESNFLIYDAAVVAQSNNNYPSGSSLEKPAAAVALTSGLKFKLLVKRTAPGDPTVYGTITVTPADSKGVKVEGAAVYTIPVEIYTSATLARAYLTEEAKAAGETIETTVDGHVWINVGDSARLYIYDRNVETALIEHSPIAYNSGSHALDVNNSIEWRGGMWKLTEMIEGKRDIGGGAYYYACRPGWRLFRGYEGEPEDLPLIQSKTRHSKDRTFILSDGLDERGNHMGCFLPYASSGLTYYYSTTKVPNTDNVGCLFNNKSSVRFENYQGRYNSLVRAVRTVPNDQLGPVFKK